MPKAAHRAPLAIGDSTMLLALPDLRRHGFAANAHGCRQWPEALRLMRSLRAEGRLPRLVVVALGADGAVRMPHIRAALRILGRNRRLVLVTPIELGGGSGSDADVVRRSAGVYPGRINVLDWVRRARGNGSWFQPDGLHLTFPGAAAFARFLAGARSLADRTPTVFGDAVFTKPGATARIPATIRLETPPGWAVVARRSPSGLPALTVRRRRRCPSVVQLTAHRPRLRDTAGPKTVAAARRRRTPPCSARWPIRHGDRPPSGGGMPTAGWRAAGSWRSETRSPTTAIPVSVSSCGSISRSPAAAAERPVVTGRRPSRYSGACAGSPPDRYRRAGRPVRSSSATMPLVTGYTITLLIHLLCVIAFVGGQLAMAVVVSPVMRGAGGEDGEARMRKMAMRFGIVSAVALTVLIMTGIIMAVDKDLMSNALLSAKMGILLLIFAGMGLHYRLPYARQISIVILLLSVVAVVLGVQLTATN